MLFYLLTPLFATLAAAVAGTAEVDLSHNTGKSQHVASGFIYGTPDTPNQIPDHFYSDIGFGYGRAGGAQTPGRGWIWGISEYKERFASALSNYHTTLQHGGIFIFLLHDLWGADGSQNATAPYPGDNGDWTFYDEYLTQWISDMKANGATKDLVIDIWNEPDGTFFWNRPQPQWIQMSGRAYYRLKVDFPEVQTTGPCLASEPSLTNTWWTNWSTFIVKNNSIPDQYDWHMESGTGDMQSTLANFSAISAAYHLPKRIVNINEYAILNEQVPCGGAWWISQLERVNTQGLRGNWLSAEALHDFMAGLVGKPNANTPQYNATEGGYWPTGEFQVYKYYNQDMTGHRVATTPTKDLSGDVYATVDDKEKKVRVLVGARITTGTWQVKIDFLSSVGLPKHGVLDVRTFEFAGNASNHEQRFDAPIDLGTSRVSYSGDSVLMPIHQTDNVTTWAFEFHTI